MPDITLDVVNEYCCTFALKDKSRMKYMYCLLALFIMILVYLFPEFFGNSNATLFQPPFNSLQSYKDYLY